MEVVVVTNGAVGHAKFQSNHHHLQTKTQLLTPAAQQEHCRECSGNWTLNTCRSCKHSAQFSTVSYGKDHHDSKNKRVVNWNMKLNSVQSLRIMCGIEFQNRPNLPSNSPCLAGNNKNARKYAATVFNKKFSCC